MTLDSDSRSDSRSRSPTPRSRRNGTSSSSKGSSKSHRRSELTKIIQVSNIAPQANREQMITMFGYIGKIDDLRLYPTVDLGQMSAKICFVKFYEGSTVGLAQHLTNTVFIDRALIITPFLESDIPDEQRGLEILGSGTLPGMANEPKIPPHLVSQIDGVYPHQLVVTVDPNLAEHNLPSYPPIPFLNNDTRKIEEIRRTLLIANLDSDLSSDEVIEFFGRAGEVKYFRFCTRDNDPLRYALIEFSQQPSILAALTLNGTKLGNKYIKVYHSTQAIVKPQAKTNEAARKEIEEAMSRQAQNIISQGIEATTGKDKRRRSSRSRSVSRRRSRSRSRRRSRSRGRRRRSRSRSRSRSRRTSSHRSSKRKSRSKTPKRSRSISRERRSHKKKRSRSRERVKSPSRSRSRSRSKREDKKKKEKKVKKEKDRDRSRDRTKDREKGKDRDKDRSKGKEREQEVVASAKSRIDNGFDIQDDSN